MSAPRISTLTADDAGACVALEIAAFNPVDRFATRVWRRLIGPAQESGSVLALGIRGPRQCLVGAIVVLLRRNSRVARIYSLAVDPGRHRRGLGTRLITAVIRRLPPRCTTLALEVRVDNAVARGLYQRMGFVPTATLTDFYGDGSPGIRYELALPVRPPPRHRPPASRP
jgi:[ribosomal protein S18]-alanine N-acetyltransferase